MLNLLLADAPTITQRANGAEVLVAPTYISAAAAAGATRIVTVAGYPTGRHHSLIKASEARLAVQMGADEVWVSVDDTIDDANHLLADLVTIREACPNPAKLGLLYTEAALKPAEQAGFDVIITQPGEESPETELHTMEFPDGA